MSRLVKYSAVFGVAGAILVSGCQLIPNKTPQAVVGDNWQLVWSDEFNGTDIDATKWSWETNCWGGGNNEQQCYTDRAENSFIRDGALVIQAKPEEFTGPAEPLDWESNAGEKTLPYTSARLRTLDQGDWTFGRIEVRAKLPSGQGIWPAIWMLPTDWEYGGWASSGEIDIMETVNLSDDQTKWVAGTLHYGRDWPANSSSGARYEFAESDPTVDFHTYAIEWANGEIRWYIDDVHYATQRETGWFSQSEDDDGKLVNNAGAAPFDKRFHLLLNVAVGGNWPGNPDDSTAFPVEMEIDYVRVFECPTASKTLVTCATKDRKAERVFGNQAPEIIDVVFDENIMQSDDVVFFADEALAPFALGQYVASGTVDMGIVQDGEHGNVTRIQFNTDESVVYFQAPMGWDISAFDRIEFDLKLLSDTRDSGGLMYKLECFYPCGTGDYALEMPATGQWTHYSFKLEDLVNHPGSSLDLTNVNTPFVIFPDWGNQQGVVILVDNVMLKR